MEQLEEYIEQEMMDSTEGISVYIHEKTVWNLERRSDKSVKEYVEGLGYTTVRPWFEHGNAVIVYPKGYKRDESADNDHSLFFAAFAIFIVLVFLSFL